MESLFKSDANEFTYGTEIDSSIEKLPVTKGKGGGLGVRGDIYTLLYIK